MPDRPKIKQHQIFMIYFKRNVPKHVSKKVGHLQTIATIEKAKYYPSLELAFLISRVFSKEISDVFEFDFSD